MATKDDRRTIFGWCMYDWANSAYVTTVVAALLPIYFATYIIGREPVQLTRQSLQQLRREGVPSEVLGKLGDFVDGGVRTKNDLEAWLRQSLPREEVDRYRTRICASAGARHDATVLWSYMASAAAFFVFLCAPVLGAISDFSASKKRFLLAFAYGGSLFAILLYFTASEEWSAAGVYKTMAFFVISQIGFVAANIFYDAFLPQIASEEKMDWVSGKGYAFGYVGGGLQFALALGLMTGHEALGISKPTAARIGMAMAGIWWAGFTLFTAKYLPETGSAEPLPERYRRLPRLLAYGCIGMSRTFQTARHVGRFRHLLIFLIAYMLYNDGIQTVIKMATMYGQDELALSATVLMVTLLMIQVIASGGALLFSQIAKGIGTKRAVMLALALWCGVVSYAYFINGAVEYLILGVVVGIVLGGSQALSRSFYGSMVPEDASAEFYGFYSVFSKFSAIWGPLVFGVIRQLTGSARLSIVSLIGFFVAGLVLLSFVDEKKARQATFSISHERP